MSRPQSDPDPPADSLTEALAANANLQKFIGERRPTADDQIVDLLEDLLANYQLEE